MRKIKFLSFIAVALVPMVVISFVYDSDEANFYLEKSNNGNVLSKFGMLIGDEECVDMGKFKDIEVSMRVLRGNSVVEVPLEEYVTGVVAGEMPASFSMEALKAQAVAARTYALYRKSQNGSKSYDVTDDTRTQVYIDKGQMQKKWGNEFDKYYNRVSDAANGTAGEVITYGGKIIEAFYFAMSSGNTQDAVYVFNQSRDYLKGVSSEYENNSISGFQVVKDFEPANVKKLFGLTCKNLRVDNIKYNNEGYCENLTLCGKKINGMTFANKMGLRSSSFKIEMGNKMKITTKGFGHGVGMSQYGANGYASNGYTYDEIIKHYYTGVEISNLKNV